MQDTVAGMSDCNASCNTDIACSSGMFRQIRGRKECNVRPIGRGGKVMNENKGKIIEASFGKQENPYTTGCDALEKAE